MLAILALLGVPLWLILGWLAAGLWHRHDVEKNLPGLFKMKVRVLEGTYRHLDGNYSRTAAIAIWAHDILIIEKGLLLGRNLHFPVDEGLQPPQSADPKQVKGRLGDKPVTMQFQLDDSTIIEVAAAGEDSTLAQGPFFTDLIDSVSIR
jgi:hypothetical protein